ncbi:uncharacterized protein LOC115446243 [Manduca sexta]|uniref:uncharacterized protein LOC115446243 n=1 Tax=Manduca sexta TaxID=7130 RepID=UPI00188EFAAE|nr:uncharacterized protein LOC115446243 [Manduca sexta]
MKVFLLALLVALAAAQTIHDGQIFDQFNIKEIMSDDVQRKLLLDCVLDRSPCGKYQIIKDKTPSILETKCGDCTRAQKAKFEEAIKTLERDYIDEFKALKTLYAV